MINKALDDVRVLYDGGISRTGWGGCIRKEDVVLWSEENELSIGETFNQVGVALARAYTDHTLDWDLCDSAANDLFAVLMEFYTDKARDVAEPELFWRFYEAFDHSETVEADKIDEVARAEIDEFLSRLSAEP